MALLPTAVVVGRGINRQVVKVDVVLLLYKPSLKLLLQVLHHQSLSTELQRISPVDIANEAHLEVVFKGKRRGTIEYLQMLDSARGIHRRDDLNGHEDCALLFEVILQAGDVVFVVSASCAKSLAELGPETVKETTVVSIGSETSRNLPFPHITASVNTIQGMINAYIDHLWSVID